MEDKITIPKFFMDFINPHVDLEATPKICCPFHQEDTPSFSYSSELSKWRCFGSCKAGGDLHALAKMYLKIFLKIEPSNKNAEDFLRRKYGLDTREKRNLLEMLKGTKQVQYRESELDILLSKICFRVERAKNVDMYVELDYLMSKACDTDAKIYELEKFERKWFNGSS